MPDRRSPKLPNASSWRVPAVDRGFARGLSPTQFPDRSPARAARKHGRIGHSTIRHGVGHRTGPKPHAISRSLAGPRHEKAWAILSTRRSGLGGETHGPLAPCKSKIDRGPAPRGSTGQFGRPAIGYGVGNRMGPQPREIFRSFFRSHFEGSMGFFADFPFPFR